MKDEVTNYQNRVESFAQEYVALGARRGATPQAAAAAGIGTKGNAPYNFFARPEVQKRIAELLAERYGEQTITAQRVFEEMGAIAFADPADWMDETGQLLPPHRLSPRARAAIASIDFETRMEGRGEEAVPVHTIKVRTHGKNEMLKLMAQHFKIISNNDGINALATELTKQLREGRARAKALRAAGVTDAEDAVIIPRQALTPPEPVPVQQEREDYA
jgi:phage terminase small subunit